MKKGFIITLLLVLLFGCIKESSEQSEVFRKQINNRLSQLKSNYKYEVLVEHQQLPSLELLEKSFIEINAQDDLNLMNEKINQLENELGIYLLKLTDYNKRRNMLMNEVFVYDYLLGKTMESMNYFENLTAEVVKVNTNPKVSEYKVFLRVTDEKFNPTAYLDINDQTYPIEVKEGDYALIRISKNNGNDQDFAGRIIVDENGDKLMHDFKYLSPPNDRRLSPSHRNQ